MDRKRHIAILAGLLALVCAVQLVRIRLATVPALDAVHFVEIARRIDTEGFFQTLRQEREQPLFPAWVWLVHEGLERTAGPLRSSWAVSVQLAAAIPLVLAVVPVYFLSLRLVGPAPAAAGSLFFCLLPEVSRLGADGLGDGIYLMFFCLAFWAVAVYLTRSPEQQARVQVSEARVPKQVAGKPPLPCPTPLPRRSPMWLLIAGMLTGLAVLVRAEALVFGAALVLALLAFEFRAERRQAWARLVAAAGCLALGCGMVLGTYLVAVRATTPRIAAQRILGRYEPEEEHEALRPTPAGAAIGAGDWRLADGEPMSFAPKELTTSIRRRGYAAAAVQLADELAEAFAYLIGAFALFGLWRLRRSLGRPIDRFVQIYVLLFAVAALHFASKEGYVSARHLLTVVVIGVGCAGYGALEIGDRLEIGNWLANWRRGARRIKAGPRSEEATRLARSPWAWAVVLAAAAACLVESRKPLHASRRGHRLAGEWLAHEAESPGPVLDTRGWTGLYSGRTTYRYDDAQAAFSHPELAYVVVERPELEYESRRSRTLNHLLRIAAEPVAVFSDPDGALAGQRPVVVYRWNPECFARWIAARSKEPSAREDRHARARPHVYGERI